MEGTPHRKGIRIPAGTRLMEEELEFRVVILAATLADLYSCLAASVH